MGTLFKDKIPVDKETNEIDMDILYTKDKDAHVEKSKGRLFVGPIRILQKRTKPLPCKRKYKFEHGNHEHALDPGLCT